MQFRDTVNQHSGAFTAACAVALVVALIFLVWRIVRMGGSQGDQRTPMVYFYDQNTGELFPAPASTAGPIETPSGEYQGESAGVRASVFACGQCSDESKRFIGYLSKPLSEDEQPQDSEPLEWIKRVDDTQWHRSDTKEAIAILDEARTRCPEGTWRNLCLPDPE